MTWEVLIDIIIFVGSAIPLYLAANFLGGKASLLKTLLVAFVTGIIVGFIRSQFQFFGGIIAFFLLIWIYHEMFRITWLKSFFVWLLQFLIVLMFYLILAFFRLGTSFIS
ncbi:MAG: hypothetical protein ABIC95_03970 [archaeon]